jgi:hypothetical protein
MTWIAACSGKRGTYQEVVMKQNYDDLVESTYVEPGHDVAPITNDDLQYLRNINTKPGPDSGKSIDPTKPGPDDALAQSDAGAFDPMEAAATELEIDYETRGMYQFPDNLSARGSFYEGVEWAIERLRLRSATPPLRYSDTVEKSPDGTETRRLEVDRQKLIEWLRESAPDWTVSGKRVQMACDEIERLAAENERLAEEIKQLEKSLYWSTPMTGNASHARLYIKLRTHNPDPSWQTVFDEAALEIDWLAEENRDLWKKLEKALFPVVPDTERWGAPNADG